MRFNYQNYLGKKGKETGFSLLEHEGVQEYKERQGNKQKERKILGQAKQNLRKEITKEQKEKKSKSRKTRKDISDMFSAGRRALPPNLKYSPIGL